DRLYRSNMIAARKLKVKDVEAARLRDAHLLLRTEHDTVSHRPTPIKLFMLLAVEPRRMKIRNGHQCPERNLSRPARPRMISGDTPEPPASLVLPGKDSARRTLGRPACRPVQFAE